MSTSEISEEDQLLLVNRLLPQEVGLFKHKVVHTCLDATEMHLAVGSEQGNFWVMDMKSRRMLLKEVTDSRVPICTIGLHPKHSFVAIGSKEGVVEVTNYLKPLVHEAVYEKACRPVSAMCWSQPGDRLFIGFDMGKLLAFSIDINKLQLRPTPLLECESEVIQLSNCKGLLLISTLTQSLLLTVDSGIANQVGSRERKPGKYGGCFLSDKDLLMVARPGLRLWMANQLGKVQSTAKFRAALEQSLPTIAFYGGISRPVQLQMGWQFTILQPLDGHYLVTFHANTLLVMEPESLLCVGAMTLGTAIVGVVTAGRHIFALCSGHQRPVVKLSLPAPQEKQVVAPPLGDTHPSCSSSQNRTPQAHCIDQEHERTACEKLDDDICLLETNLSGSTPATLTLSTRSPGSDSVLAGTETQGEPEPVLPILQPPNVPSPGNVSPSPLASERSMLLLTAVEAKLQLVADKFIPLGKKGEQQAAESISPVPAVVVTALSSEEAERRTKMLGFVDQEEVEEGDDVAVSAGVKKNRKTRKAKTRKRKKHTPSSSAHGSIERLPEAVAAEGSSEFGNALLMREDTQPQTPLAQENERENHDAQPSMSLAQEDERENQDAQPSMSLAQENERENQDTQPRTPLTWGDEDKSQSEQAMKSIADNNEARSIPACQSRGDSIGGHFVPYSTFGVSELAHSQKLQAPLQREDDHQEQQHYQDELPSSQLDQQTLPPTNISIIPKRQHPPIAVDTDRISSRSSGTEQQAMPSLNHALLHTGTERQSSEQDPLVENSSGGSSQPSPLQIRLRANAFLSPPSSDNEEEQTPGEKEQASKFQQQVGEQEEEVQQKSLVEEKSQLFGPMPETSLKNEEEMSALSHPLEQTDSESEEELDHSSRSGVASDYHSLVGSLVRQSRHTDPGGRALPLQRQQTPDIYILSRVGMSLPSTPAAADAPSKEIWIPLTQPSANRIQSICLSATTLWLTDSRGHIYCTRAGSGGQNWLPLSKHMSQVASSPSGKIVWGVHHNQAYGRHGISDLDTSGSVWRSLTKSSSHIKWIACDEVAVWAIEVDGRVLYRMGVSEGQPQGNIWHRLAFQGITFVHVACCKGILWALDSSGQSFVRDGITPSEPYGKAWRNIWSPSFAAVSVVESGMVWGIDFTDRLWFRCGATLTMPDGDGLWWEVSVSGEDKNASLLPWKLMAVERSSSFLTSLISSHHKLATIAACSRAGVCVLTSEGLLHACWSVATGYHYIPACRHGVFDLSNWKRVGAGSYCPWVVRDDGELYCIISSDKAIRVECQGSADVLATSPTAIWVFSNGEIWSRQSMSKEICQGVSWEYIERGSHMCDVQIRGLAIGKRAVWAIDQIGHIHFRFGVHPREPGTGMAPAWVPVEGHAQPLSHICVSPDDWLVWALDTNHNAYVRKEVTPDFPVGTSWEVVPGQQLKDVSTACGKVFALSVSGELLSRQGVSKDNPAGNYWRRLPGKFKQLSTSPMGEIWVVNDSGHVLHQRTKTMAVCHGRSRQEELESCLSDVGWEVV